jgi:hypothetical protein
MQTLTGPGENLLPASGLAKDLNILSLVGNSVRSSQIRHLVACFVALLLLIAIWFLVAFFSISVSECNHPATLQKHRASPNMVVLVPFLLCYRSSTFETFALDRGASSEARSSWSPLCSEAQRKGSPGTDSILFSLAQTMLPVQCERAQTMWFGILFPLAMLPRPENILGWVGCGGCESGNTSVTCA